MGIGNQSVRTIRETEQLNLLGAVEQMLVPIARILARAGIQANDFVIRAKLAYLTALSQHLEEGGLPITDKRLQIFSGLTGSEIQRLKANAPVPNGGVQESDELAVLIKTWHNEPPYVFPMVGGPLELPIKGRDPPSFETLCEQCAPSQDPEYVLEMLTRAKLVTVNPETNNLILTGRAFVPAAYDPAFIEQTRRAVVTLAETLDANFKSGQETDSDTGRYQRIASADWALTEEDEAEFGEMARTECQKTLEAIDSWLSQRKHGAESGYRVGVGIYQLVERSLRTDATGPEGNRRNVRVITENSSSVFVATQSEKQRASRDDGDDPNVIDVLAPTPKIR